MFVHFSLLPLASPPSLLLSFICPSYFFFFYFITFVLVYCVLVQLNKIAFLVDWENLNFLMCDMRELD